MLTAEEKKHTKRKAIAAVIAFILIVVIAFIAIYSTLKDEKQNWNPLSVFTQKDPGYNFEELKNQYPDIIGWIKVPGTPIDTPIVQEPQDDFYYLTHNAEKQYDPAGAAYIQHHNKADFSDPVTLLYGHNMLDERIFSKQLAFADRTFFNNNEKFYVYSPGHKLTYTICSAYVYDNKHIMNSFDFSKKDVRMKYFNEVMHPKSLSQNVRDGITLTEDSKIMQLSTCMNDLSLTSQRYILTGVLDNDEVTN